MTYTHHELKEKTLAELKEIAAGLQNEVVEGYSQMNKEHLVKQLCVALKIDVHEHHTAKIPEKTGIKARIRALKQERNKLMGSHDHRQLGLIRAKIGRLKHKLRKAAV
jgi:DNA-binding IclR family transcriptional regulator